jgi:hypothetical protein
MSDPGAHRAEELLRAYWAGVVLDEAEDEDPEGEGAGLIAPFGRSWAGLAAPGSGSAAEGEAEEVAAVAADRLVVGNPLMPRPRLALVPAARGADVPAVLGWTGPANRETDTGRISAVLRSWEDRFGARLLALGPDWLELSVAAPPRTREHALTVAAEHFALCPDLVRQGAGSLRDYAEELPGAGSWHFWWD